MALPCYQMPIWQNRASVRVLREFRSLVEEYMSNVTYGSWMADYARIENEQSKSARSRINLATSGAYTAAVRAGVGTITRVYPAPAMGGLVRDVDVIRGFFWLHQDRPAVSEQNTLDALDQAIGRYERDRVRAWIRTFNPFFWINVALSALALWPFRLLGQAGFDQQKAEESLVGRVLKLIFQLTAWVASILAILKALALLGIVLIQVGPEFRLTQ